MIPVIRPIVINNDILKMKQKMTNKNCEIDMVDHLHLDMCNPNKCLLNSVEL